MGGIGLLLFLATVVESANGYNILFSRTKALENSLVLRPRIPDYEPRKGRVRLFATNSRIKF